MHALKFESLQKQSSRAALGYHLLMPLPDEVEASNPIDEVPIDKVIGYDDFMYKGHHDALSSTLCVGNTFSISPNASTVEMSSSP